MRRRAVLAARRAALIERAELDRQRLAGAAAPYVGALRRGRAAARAVRGFVGTRWWGAIPAAAATLLSRGGTLKAAGRVVAAIQIWRGAVRLWRVISSARTGR
jgi:hypothetical protein